MSACFHRKPEYSACNSRRRRKECVTDLRVCLIFSVAACVHRKPEYSACSSRRHRKECVTALRVCLIFSVGCHREPENGDLYAVFAFSRHQLYDVSHKRFTRLRKKCHNCAIAFGVGWSMGTTLINLTKLAICLIRQGPWLRLRAICLIRHGPWLQLRYVSNHCHLNLIGDLYTALA